MLLDRQGVELFHLHFVRLLCSGPDKDRFAIKGGCNLRFFFESVRYSEDLDLDVERIPVHTLKEKVGKILEGAALRLPLKRLIHPFVSSRQRSMMAATSSWPRVPFRSPKPTTA